jgi:hypothetical protein
MQKWEQLSAKCSMHRTTRHSNTELDRWREFVVMACSTINRGRCFRHRFTLKFSMSMVRDYVSELRPPVDLLFNPQVIHEHGEPCIDKRKLLIRSPEWQSYQQSSSSKQEKLTKGTMNLALRSIFVHTYQVIFTCRKILRHGPMALLPLRRKACCGFL